MIYIYIERCELYKIVYHFKSNLNIVYIYIYMSYNIYKLK